MVKRERSPADTKSWALQIEQAWLNTDQHASYGDLPLAEFTAAIAALEEEEGTFKNLQDQLTSSRNQLKLWQLVKRTRLGAKAKHGDDSDEYQRFGGTRTSEWVHQRRKRREPPEHK